jgi:hypothetical protein
LLFERDNTYYFLNTYSYDLLNSELEVELISVPNARVEIESETVTELPSSGSGSAPSSGGSTGGGGSSGGGGSAMTLDSEMSDTSTNAVQNKVIKEYVDQHPQYVVIGEEIEVPELPSGSQGSVDLTGYATEAWVRSQGYAYALNTNARIAALEERISALEKLLEGTEGASGCYYIPTGVIFADDVITVNYDRVGVITDSLNVKTTAKIGESIPKTKETTVTPAIANLVTMFTAMELGIMYTPGDQYTVEITVVTSDSNGSTTKTNSFTFIAE